MPGPGSEESARSMAVDRTQPSRMTRSVLITGAAHRIGLALARDFAAQGWAVAVHYNRSSEAARALVAEIEGQGGTAAALQADLACAAEAADLVQRTVEALGPLGCLVNNAAVFDPDDAATATRDSWDRHMEPNLRAPLRLAQDFARQLAGDNEGVVVNLIDQRVWALRDSYLSYSLSKAGLWTLTQTLALALAPRVRVVAIGPGYILPHAAGSQDQFDAAASRLPLGRPADLEDLCLTVRYLLAARSVTGQMIALDSGEHLMHTAVDRIP